jgi:2-(1,2-epoxy-1,2-dihydrophenyl)acetyl-CoA isomerase
VSVHCSIADGVGTLLIDRPDVRNAIDLDTIHDLHEGVRQLTKDNARALVLAGSGKTFSAGADLGLVRSAFDGDAASVLGPLVDDLHALIRDLRALPIPIVAGLEGPAVGAGMGLALTADLRVVAKSAVLVPGYFGIGASPDGGVSYFLTRALGAARATSAIVRNRPITSEEMINLGLAEEIVDDGIAVVAATALAASLTGAPPLALIRTRSLVDAATTQSLDAHLDAEREGVASLWPTTDFREGVAAFLERRKPNFTGQ